MTRVGAGAGALLALALGANLLGGAYASFVIGIGIAYLVAVVGLHLLVGDAGLISLAQGAFMAIGAFVFARVIQTWGAGSWLLGIAAATLAAAAVSTLIALPLLRMRGIQIPLITFMVALAGERWLLREDWFVGDTGTIFLPHLAVPFHGDLSSSFGRMMMVVVWAAAALAAITLIRRSRLGRSFHAIRSDETVAAANGVPVGRTKTLAYVIAGGFGGLGGALFVIPGGIAAPAMFPSLLSLALLSAVVIGGRGSLIGPSVAAIALGAGPILLSGIAVVIAYLAPVALIATLVLFPGGLNEQFHTHAHHLVRTFARRDREPDPPSLPAPDRGESPPSTAVVPAGPAAAAPVLSARGIVVTFDGLRAVANVDLDVGAREFVGLVGPNGAGKSTLLAALGGQLVPDHGEVSFAGRNLTQQPPHLRARLGLRRSFQHCGLVVDKTSAENLQLAADWAAAPDLGVARDLLARFGLGGGALATPAGDLPIAHARLVEVAALLATNPGVVLLDEPTAGLLPAESALLAQILSDRRRVAPFGAVVVAHDLRFLMGLVDRVVVLSDGVVVADGSPRNVRADPRVRTLYLGEPEEVR